MISRRLILELPVLLILGIAAQVILLALAILLFIPCLIWPHMLDGFYQWITRGMARIMAKMVMGRNKKREVTTVS